MDLDRELYPFESHFLETDSGRIHYVDEGEGEVLLMVHGNPTWSFLYRDLIKEFSKTNRVVAIDHMGCGLSDKPQSYDYCLNSHISNLDRLIDHLKLEGINLCVHDWGGAIGFGSLTKRKKLFKSAVVFNTAAFLSEHIPWRIKILRNRPLGDLAIRYLNAFAWPATFMTTKKALTSNVKDGYLFPYQTPDKRKAISEFVQDIPMENNHRTHSVLCLIESELPKCEMPIQIIWGGMDFCFNDHFFEKWKSYFPQAKSTYFEDAGHYVMEDKFHETSNIMKEFYQTI